MINLPTGGEENMAFMGEYLVEREETVAIADGATSGCLQTIFLESKHAYRFYKGDILLPIECQHDLVTEEEVNKLAVGISHYISSDWGIALMGYSTPMPKDDITTLFAFYSFAYKGKILSSNILVSAQSKAAKFSVTTLCRLSIILCVTSGSLQWLQKLILKKLNTQFKWQSLPLLPIYLPLWYFSAQKWQQE